MRNHSYINKPWFYILAFVVLLMGIDHLAGCTPRDGTEPKKPAKVMEEYRRTEYDIVMIDGCQYLYYDGRLTHKGNCIYCEERLVNTIDSLLSVHK